MVWWKYLKSHQLCFRVVAPFKLALFVVLSTDAWFTVSFRTFFLCMKGDEVSLKALYLRLWKAEAIRMLVFELGTYS